MGNFYAMDPTFQVEQFQDTSRTWTLEFDGSHSSFGSRANIFLMSPSKEATYFSYILEYDCTNNVTEYKAFLIGFNLSMDRNIRRLKVICDPDLIFSQVNPFFSIGFSWH
jgi:ribonuclease HI